MDDKKKHAGPLVVLHFAMENPGASSCQYVNRILIGRLSKSRPCSIAMSNYRSIAIFESLLLLLRDIESHAVDIALQETHVVPWHHPHDSWPGFAGDSHSRCLSGNPRFFVIEKPTGWLGFCPNFWRDSQVVHFMIFAEVYPFRDDELLQEWLWVIKLRGCLAGHIHHKKWVKWVSPLSTDENMMRTYRFSCGYPSFRWAFFFFQNLLIESFLLGFMLPSGKLT